MRRYRWTLGGNEPAEDGRIYVTEYEARHAAGEAMDVDEQRCLRIWEDAYDGMLVVSSREITEKSARRPNGTLAW